MTDENPEPRSHRDTEKSLERNSRLGALVVDVGLKIKDQSFWALFGFRSGMTSSRLRAQNGRQLKRAHPFWVREFTFRPRGLEQ